MPDKKSFKLYADLKEVIDAMTDKSVAKLFRAILAYENGETPELTGMVLVAFTPIKQQLDRNREAYERQCAAGESGYLGGRPSNKNPKGLQKNPKGKKHNPSIDTDTDTDKDTDTDIKNDSPIGESTRAIPKIPSEYMMMIEAHTDNPNLRQAIYDWFLMRKAKGKEHAINTPRAMQLNLNTAKRDYKTDTLQIEAFNYATEKGHKGLYYRPGGGTDYANNRGPRPRTAQHDDGATF